MKKIFLSGSTGSIGINVLNVVRNFKDNFKVAVLAINKKIDLVEPQIYEFNPEVIIVNDKENASLLRKKLGSKFQVLSGIDELTKCAADLDYDIFVGAMVGFAGLLPVIEAAKRGKRIALANKETLVVAGEYITELCKAHNSEIIPIDSEHSAIFQSLVGEDESSIEKLILTASGGPFLNKKLEELEHVSINEALNHPNWSMGNKITIDSASMMNKGLEVIEARWLFNIPADKIEIVIHPQSIIHSLVQFKDGSIKAQMGLPDMKLPIQYALSYPERFENNFSRANLYKIGRLDLIKPDYDKFECIKLAFDSLKIGGTAPCILNAANEVAVHKFLNGNIKFTDIPVNISRALNKIEVNLHPDIEKIIECDRITRDFVMNLN
ncbi:MAG TPA: 1-deoxy-D-xylulose-5-phosphate reductoisomerase [Ignavibacteriaceae bacterium]|nr:1-deoxy-D-xylulose-5-phosphate reductoisomerase [Ignavibacteriaceae bacterium]